jgi:hypothetical protein
MEVWRFVNNLCNGRDDADWRSHGRVSTQVVRWGVDMQHVDRMADLIAEAPKQQRTHLRWLQVRRGTFVTLHYLNGSLELTYRREIAVRVFDVGRNTFGLIFCREQRLKQAAFVVDAFGHCRFIGAVYGVFDGREVIFGDLVGRAHRFFFDF